MTQNMTPSEARAVGGDGAEYSFWREHTHINLSPVAAPSVLGLSGFAVATFMVAANMAGWFGDDRTTPLILAPFAFVFGGIAQFLAGMWSYRARDTLATGIHGAWGSFWIAYGIYHFFVMFGVLPGTSSPLAATAVGFWFVGLAALTWTGTFAALAENAAVALVLLTLALGSTLLAIALIGGFSTIETIAAYVLLVSAVLAWYTASAMLINAAYRRTILPTGKIATPPIPEQSQRRMIQFESGEPGIKVGQ
jgi:succinate-acetate transporter protein